MHEFEMLADPTRRRIVELLARRELTVAALAETLGAERSVSRSAVSHQLRVLREAEFVEVRESGSHRLYRLTWNAMDRLDSAVEALWVIWEDRVGWPYDLMPPEPPARLHRSGRSGLRGRTRAEIEPRADSGSWWDLIGD